MTACNQKQAMKNKIETKYTVRPNLTKPDTDTLFIQTNGQRENYLRYYDDITGFCKLRNDTIMIFNSKGFMTGKRMSIFITKGAFSFDIHEYSCTYENTYKSIEQKLTLNKNRFKINDTIVGEMSFKSIFVIDSIKHIIDTTVVTGKFKFRVRDADYDYNTLTQENNYQEFLKLAMGRPDTISSLRLWNCGFKKLPEEISLFKNLVELDLEDNDLSNADLSVLESLKKMKTISFQRCNLNEFPSVVFNFKQLKELNLYNNNIKELPSGLFQMISLIELQIGGNDYKVLPSSIGNLKNLEMLSVESTPVKIFPKSILQLPKLKKIYPPEEMGYFPPELAKYL